MSKGNNHILITKLRSYSSVFSRRVFSDIIKYGDFSHLNWLYSKYDNQSPRSFDTYLEYIKYIYTSISKSYRCEYVFKNEIINQLLLKKYGTKNTIAFNEFRVGNSIVDFAIMNGESKAFEIKTEFDSPRRLRKQMDDYMRIFNKSYIVVTSENRAFYENIIEPETGIIELVVKNRRLALNIYREAQALTSIDAGIVMKCLRTSEYENIVKSYFESLPKAQPHQMYEACAKCMAKIPFESLNELFLREIKKRKSTTNRLDTIPKEIRQIYLSMNLSDKDQIRLMSNLNKPLNINSICISHI